MYKNNNAILKGESEAIFHPPLLEDGLTTELPNDKRKRGRNKKDDSDVEETMRTGHFSDW